MKNIISNKNQHLNGVLLPIKTILSLSEIIKTSVTFIDESGKLMEEETSLSPPKSGLRLKMTSTSYPDLSDTASTYQYAMNFVSY